MRFEINTNKVKALKAALTLGVDSIAYGDDSCTIRCNAAWDQLTETTIANARESGLSLHLVTPQLLTSSDEVSRFASRAADLIEQGFTGLIVNNMGLLEAMRRTTPSALKKATLIAGRRINTYNSKDLIVLSRMGFRRATANIELNLEGISALQPPEGMTLSMLGYGPLSLAYSRMCYVMSLKGEAEYDHCGLACEKEGLDLGAKGQKPVFRLYGREILSSRRFCAAQALRRLSHRVGVLEVYLPHVEATAELSGAIALLKDAMTGGLDVSEVKAREQALADDMALELCNGALFGLPGAAHAILPA